MLTGEVNGNEKMEMVDRFQDRGKDHFILLISTLAGGVGLNLTAVGPAEAPNADRKANKVVIFDPDWSQFSMEGSSVNSQIRRTIYKLWTERFE